MIEVRNLTFSYRKKSRPIFSDFSLNIAEGGIFGLLGRNGTGKSTLLYLIAGLLTPAKGEVLYKGVNTRRREPLTLSDMFIVPEEFDLPHISLGEYIKANRKFYPGFSDEDMRRHLDAFSLESNVNLGALSMGQKKKVFMSFAMACNTSLLLMDEPTNGLDIPGKNTFRQFIAQNMTDERSIIISTHQVRDIDRLLDHIIITEGGRLLLNNSVDDVASKLKFASTFDPEVIAHALYARPSLGGTEVALVNTDGEDTELNLELLFELAMSRGEEITRMFNK